MSVPMVLEEASDAELMARVREGDREAFADLVDRHKDAVVSYITRLTGNRDRAEDFGQETFLRLFRSAGLGCPDGQSWPARERASADDGEPHVRLPALGGFVPPRLSRFRPSDSPETG